MNLSRHDFLSALHLGSSLSYFVLSWHILRRGGEGERELLKRAELLIVISVASGALWLDVHRVAARTAWPWLYLLSLISAWGCIEWRRRTVR